MSGGNPEADPAATCRLFEVAGFPRPVVCWNPDPATLPAPQLTAIGTFWSDLVAQEGQPDPAHIDPAAFVPALGYLMLLEPVDDGQDFHYRLYGTQIARWSGLDLTGQRVSEITGAGVRTHVQAFFMAGYYAVVVRRQPLYSAHVPPAERTTATWHRLILPFRDTAAAVSRLLVGNVPLPERASGVGPLA